MFFNVAIAVALCVSLYGQCTASSVSPKDAAFTKWFRDNGGIINGIEVAGFPLMGRGFAAVKSLTENEQILQIPHKMIFSTKNMPNHVDERTKKILDTLGSDAALYAWLLLEKHKDDSFFKPYLDVMPSYVPSLINFSDLELAELQSATLVKEVLEMKQSAEADYKAFTGAYKKITSKRSAESGPAPEISFDEYLWSMSMFNSRGLRFQGPVYMAPMADIFNFQRHPAARPPNNGDFFAKHHKLDASGITVLSDRAHSMSDRAHQASQQQVFEDYGDNSDEIYFKYHGFVPDENPFRCATLGFDHIGADLVGNTMSGVSAGLSSTVQSSTTAPLLPGVTQTHKALVEALEFSRLPSKCVDQVPENASAGIVAASNQPTSIGGYFGKGLEVLLILLSFTEAEASHCLNYIHTSTAAASSQAGTRGGAKNWPGIFKECSFSSAEEYVRNVRTGKISGEVSKIGTSLLSASDDGTLTGDAPMSDRVVHTIHKFLELNVEQDQITTSIDDDHSLLSQLQTQLSVGGQADGDHSVLHKYLAVKYRYHRKRLLLGIAERYGADKVVQKLTSRHRAIEENPPGWLLEDTSLSTDTSATIKVAATPLPFDAPLSERIRAFNQWFHSLQPTPCHITALEIPEFRLGTIATKNIAKNEIYLGIAATNGGIMDSEVAMKGPNEAVSGLLSQLTTAYPKRDDFHELLFFLLHERFVLQEKSFYWPYLSLLPSYEDMENNAFVPLLWAEEDIKTRLGPSDVAGLITDYHIKTRNRFNSIVKMPLIQKFFPNRTSETSATPPNGDADTTVYDVFTFRNYQWATVILDSRSIWWSGKRHLVPMLDFVNCQEHSVDRSILHSTVLDDAGKYAITKSGRYIHTANAFYQCFTEYEVCSEQLGV